MMRISELRVMLKDLEEKIGDVGILVDRNDEWEGPEDLCSVRFTDNAKNIYINESDAVELKSKTIDSNISIVL